MQKVHSDKRTKSYWDKLLQQMLLTTNYNSCHDLSRSETRASVLFRNPGQCDVQLAMGEDKPSEIDSNAVESEALKL
jgi:hypothetical protein